MRLRLRVDDFGYVEMIVYVSNVFWWLNLVRLYSLYKITIPQKEDRILLYKGYHSIPKENATHVGFPKSRVSLKGLVGDIILGYRRFRD